MRSAALLVYNIWHPETSPLISAVICRGAKEALVVAYDHKEFYHGSDGFNDVVFPDSPDTSRIKGKVIQDAKGLKKTQMQETC